MNFMRELINQTTGKKEVAQLEVANSFWSRLRGLQFRRSLARDHGFLLVPCASIHTAFLRFPIDVVFLDAQGTVLDVRSGLRPWRVAVGPRNTHAVLELPSGTAQMRAGDVLRMVSDAPDDSAGNANWLCTKR